MLPEIANTPGQKSQLPFKGFPHGLNTSVPAFQIGMKELAECVNFKFNRGGQLESRPPIARHTNTPLDTAVVADETVSIGDTRYELIVGADNTIHYLDGSNDPVLIGNVSGPPKIIPYNGQAVVCDGSYLKYIDDVSSIKIAYDVGEYQFQNEAVASDGSTELDGTIVRVATKFTTAAWGSGYTIPPIKASVMLSKVGTPAANPVVVHLREVDGDASIANVEVTPDATTLPTSPALEEVSFVAPTEMDPGTEYYLSVEYSGGTAGNCARVHWTTEASGGDYAEYATSWTAVGTKSPIMKLTPGLPPKARFGGVRKSRLWIAGSPDNPGWMCFCGLSITDWSTAGMAGWVGAVDDDRNNFSIGAIVNLYGQLWVFGTEEQPYLAQLTGDSPSEFALPLKFQQAWTTHKAVVSVGNDLWSGSADGVDALSGVQEYGDVRTFSASDPIFDRIRAYWDSATAIAGYYPRDGQFMLSFPGYHRVLIGHTKAPTQGPDGATRYPWSEYELYRDKFSSDRYQWVASGDEYYLQAPEGGDPEIVEPDAVVMGDKLLTAGTKGALTALSWAYDDDPTTTYKTVWFGGDTSQTLHSVLIPTCISSDAKIGGSDGHVYRFDPTKYTDLESIQVRPRAATAYIVADTHVNIDRTQLLASSKGGGQIYLSFYRDDLLVTPAISWQHVLPLYDGTTIDELGDMKIEDMVFAIDSRALIPWRDCDIDARSFQLRFSNIIVSGHPIYIDGAIITIRKMEM